MARILIVDDEETFCVYFAQYLSAQGFTVEHVCDGFEALGRVQRNGFDAVISDIRMPGIDGPELVQLVKVWSPDTHAFLMTAFDVPSGIDTALSGVFRKPFDFAEVVMTLRSILQPLESKSPSGATHQKKGVKEHE